MVEPQNIFFPLSLILYGIGLLLNGAVLLIAGRDRTLRRNIHDKGLICLSASSFLWCLVLIVCLIIALANGGYGGSLGSAMCSIEGLSVSFLVGITMTCHFALAFDRWTLVWFDGQLARKWIVLAIGLTLMMDLIAFVGMLAKPASWMKEYESKAYCFVRSWDYNSLSEIWPTLFSLVNCWIVSNLVFLMYSGVYRKTVLTSRARRAMEGKGVSPTFPATSTSELEKRVFYRCCLIVGSFSLLYTPSLLALIVRIATNAPLSPWTDGIISNVATLDVIVTPLIILYTREDYQKSLKRAWK